MPVTATHSPILISVIVEVRRFQIVVVQDGPTSWRATISERTGSLYNTQALGLVETTKGLGAALHLAFASILRVAGVADPDEGERDELAAPPTAPVPMPWRRLDGRR